MIPDAQAEQSIFIQTGKIQAPYRQFLGKRRSLQGAFCLTFFIPVLIMKQYEKIEKALTKTVEINGTSQRAGVGGSPVQVDYS